MEHSASPDIITNRASNAELTAELRNRRERNWNDSTPGAILAATADLESQYRAEKG